MAEFDLTGRKPFYANPELGNVFVYKPRDLPDGYDIIIGRDHFYLPSRVLPELTSERATTTDMVKKLNNVNFSFETLLKLNEISPAQFHLDLMRVRNKELEIELAEAYNTIGDLTP
ncbi:hypothetical protein COU54_01500 [Candidatus Pacearchaeota archaeon CG10_big_fil_rev_8_21_14_0_10_31_24]|nr:MAG: hypothetical protein COU54_01500 [Candidatus Pacearchaeota archaeon CG10_big_fil_rev_8_21_14_0_10_31_24]